MGQVISYICDKFKINKEPSPVEEYVQFNHNTSIIIEKGNCISPDVSITIDLPSAAETPGPYFGGRGRTSRIGPLQDISNLPHDKQTISEYVTARQSIKHYRSRSPSVVSKSSKKIKIDDHLDFPILKDDFTKEYILKSKVLVVIRGISGSGKSFLAEALLQIFGNDAAHCSADDYFIQDDGRYVFDGSQLKEAHNACYQAAYQAMAVSQHHLVIVNNTNVKFWEYKRYLQLARENWYCVVLLEPQTPWAKDADQLIKKTVHGVPEEVIRAKLLQYQPSQPFYCGWFLNSEDSSHLTSRAWDWLRLVMNHGHLQAYCHRTAPQHEGGDQGPYYRPCGPHGAFQPLHCTAMFLGRGRATGAQEYLDQSVVMANTGRAYSIMVTGFVITPRSIGARVVLPKKLQSLWGQEVDGAEMSDDIKELFSRVSDNSKPLDDTSDIFTDADVCANVPEDSDTHGTCRDISYDDVKRLSGDMDMNRLSPSVRGAGRRAHITLAVAPGVPAVVTGYDLLRLLTMEQEALGDISALKDNSWRQPGTEAMEVDQNGVRREPIITRIDEGVIADYGEGMFAIYPTQCMELSTLFSACYY